MPADSPGSVSAADWRGIRAAHDASLREITRSGDAHGARHPDQCWQTRFDGGAS
jgi:hypothetical protein